ncbi:MAG: hypothetical protein FJZ43_01460 [Candidatus Staskawiczbacteria bacterium]|nr:hypothetical protein [Candidatus Staskawiczbacteria bacterium]
MEKYKFHVKGMHCASCVVLTESQLSDLPGVFNVKASLKQLSVEVTGDFGSKTPEDIAKDLSVVLKPYGYELSIDVQSHNPKWRGFLFAVPLALGFIIFFIILQKIGLVNLITTSDVNYGTAFLIGLVASVSTCMAVVGGLVLSISANFAKHGDKFQPQILFHIGRLISFVILGGIIGALGAVFKIGATGTFILSITVALVLFILGINLLDIFPWAKKIQPTMPHFIGKRMHSFKDINHTLTPLLVGVVTFFLPCGFTQSMQIYTLTTGSFFTGALIMTAFAIGTLPVLLLLSFSSVGIHKKTQSGIFFKTAGLIVLFFAILNLISAFAGAGIIPPLFNF